MVADSALLPGRAYPGNRVPGIVPAERSRVVEGPECVLAPQSSRLRGGDRPGIEDLRGEYFVQPNGEVEPHGWYASLCRRPLRGVACIAVTTPSLPTPLEPHMTNYGQL